MYITITSNRLVGIQRAYSASQRLILSTGGRLKTSWRPIATQQQLDVVLREN